MAVMLFSLSIVSTTKQWRHSGGGIFASTEDNLALQSPFLEEEVLSVIKECESDKAPGPDGFSMGFFQKCWNVIRQDMLDALNFFHEKEFFLRSLNATFIALIPKKNGVKEVRDFRPISLVGSFYKILSKVLAGRLKRIIGKLVMPQQMAFIKGRQITDASLIANECIDSRSRQGLPGILCKLDIEKAFDHVHWNFLLSMLKDMGFGTKWINWIRFCISSVRFSILINGSPCGFFNSQRGLRQGDSLSPFLFILVMEGLSRMLSTAVQYGWLRGFTPAIRSPSSFDISHILFADDTLIFCDAEVSQVLHLRVIFLAFEAVSGLHINYAKSQLLPVNMVPNIQLLADFLGCSIGSFPTTYLGLPLGAKSTSSGIWEGILEKCEKKLSNWKRQYLSLGGRLVLINSVLDALPTYTMSLFPLLAAILKRLDKLRRDFLWHGNKEKKSFNLVKWDIVTHGKKDGGLGVRDLKAHNKSLMGKWLWRFNSEENALWRKVITTKYNMTCPWITRHTNAPLGLGIWKHIRANWDFFWTHSNLIVGNGRKIKFWQDSWLGHSPLKDVFPELFSCSSNPQATIADCKQEGDWFIPYRRPFNDWEMEDFSRLLQLLQRTPLLIQKSDSLKWNSHTSGIFSVKSSYELLTASPYYPTIWPWKVIWKSKAPYKIKCFSWLVVRGKCLTIDNLQKRGLSLCNRCPLCEENEESINHLFLHCKISCQVWNFILSILGLHWCMPLSTVDLLLAWKKKGMTRHSLGLLNSIPAAVWWVLWKERNARIFENKKDNIVKLKYNCILLLSFWSNIYSANLLEAEDMVDFISFLHYL